MLLLILGLLLWSLSHMLRRIAPTYHAELGKRGYRMVAIASGVGIVLMIFGYRAWDSGQLWYPPAGMRHVNNLLMLIAIYLFAASGMKTWVARRFRHPMLTGVIVWAVAHLLVNGDWASVVLFGGMLVWALLEMALINRDEPQWVPPSGGSAGKEIGALVGAVVVLGVIGYIHGMLGYWPFG
ncbi:NnrU family protein [Marivivens aquimaris]|uniref:NnrU family protein n=1 Tax=Marivivens aquimaris TaxID=2774876 RepID=UPI0018802DE2|nr:NnrU family protein [Marivivens aquimaris]